MTLPCNKLSNIRRRVDRARDFPTNTCAASRHVHIMAEALAVYGKYGSFDDPEWCALSLLSVLESLWKLRTKAAKHGLYP